MNLSVLQPHEANSSNEKLIFPVLQLNEIKSWVTCQNL